jgi:hypothetical protein
MHIVSHIEVVGSIEVTGEIETCVQALSPLSIPWIDAMT